MVANYVDRYPSQLPGGALEGALPPGPEDAPAPSKRIQKPEYDPNSPRPDVEHYDPNKVKLPDQAPAGDAGDTAAPAAPTTAAPADDAPKPAKPAKSPKSNKPPRSKK
jgi:hypothetical protein